MFTLNSKAEAISIEVPALEVILDPQSNRVTFVHSTD